MSVEKAPGPIIVFGAPRSGTTYLIRILNAHPEVYVSGESRLFVWVHRSLSTLTDDDRAINAHRDKFVAHLMETYPSMIRDFYHKVAPQIRWWGDKNPFYGAAENEGCLQTIAALYEEAKFIHLIRDVRAIAASYQRKGWGSFEGVLEAWPRYLRIAGEFGASCSPDRFLELRYEDLIEDDLGWARSLFAFLEIDLRSVVVDFCREQCQNRTPFSEPTRDLSGNITRQEWRDVLTRDQQRECLKRLGDRLVALGYESEESLAARAGETG